MVSGAGRYAGQELFAGDIVTLPEGTFELAAGPNGLELIKVFELPFGIEHLH